MEVEETMLTTCSDSVEVGVATRNHRFPLLIQRTQNKCASQLATGAGGLLEFWTEQREWLDRRLHEYGAILFRGFAISEQSTFQAAISHLKEQLLDYVDGNSPRTR